MKSTNAAFWTFENTSFDAKNVNKTHIKKNQKQPNGVFCRIIFLVVVKALQVYSSKSDIS